MGVLAEVYFPSRLFLIDSIDVNQLWIYGCVILFLPFIYHAVCITRYPGGPPFLKGYLPYLGVAIPFLRNPEGFLRECQEEFGGIFTLYMGGKRLHVVSDPISGIPTIWRNPKVFTFSVLANQFDITLFGVAEKQAKDTVFYKAQLKLIQPHLFASEAVTTLIKNFNDNLQIILPREIAKLGDETKLETEGVVVNLDQWLKRLLFECSGRSFFGPTWPNDDDFFNDFYMWDEGIYSILKNYPSFLTKKAIDARERYYKKLEDMFLGKDFAPARVILERVNVNP
jgi:hypothetical protein